MTERMVFIADAVKASNKAAMSCSVEDEIVNVLKEAHGRLSARSRYVNPRFSWRQELMSPDGTIRRLILSFCGIITEAVRVFVSFH
jgi:hypothetical protein